MHTSNALGIATRRAPWTRAVLVVLGVIVAAALAEPLIAIGDPVSRNYNEGWNAWHATAVLQDGDLYPDPGAFVFDNYPPLSFLVIAGLSAGGADPLVVGRVLALVSLFVVAGCVGWIAYSLTVCRATALIATALVLTVVTVHFHQYVAMNDPQMFGHALQWLGFALFLRRTDSARARWTALLLLVAGGAVKHNLIALPLAVIAWMFVHRRDDAVRFLAKALVVVGLATAAMGLVHGWDLFAGVLGHAREVHLWRVRAAVENWSIPIAPVLGAALVALPWRRREARVDALLVVLVVGLGSGLVFSTGAGVNYNVVFDAVFASAALAALAVHAVGEGAKANTSGRDARRAVALLVVVSTTLAAAPARIASGWNALSTRDVRLDVARADLAFARSVPGPALCATPAYAHWAGKDFEVDVFNYGQAVRTGTRDVAPLLERIRSHHYALIQLRSHDRENLLTPEMVLAIDANYRPVRTSPVYGTLYLPGRDDTP